MEANSLPVLLQPLLALILKVMAGTVIDYQKYSLPRISPDKHLQETKKRFAVEYRRELI